MITKDHTMEDFLLLDQEFSSDELLLRDNVQRFVSTEVVARMPSAFEQGTFPLELASKCADLGLFGMSLPTQYGGSNANSICYGLVCQELEKGDSGLRSFVSVQNSLCMYPIFQFGDESQRERYLPAMARAEVIGCFGLTEPDAGSNPASMKTRAEKVAGGWRLNGSKMWITNAPIADIAIIWAMTHEGIRGFIVDKHTPGFSTREMTHKMSLRASLTGEIHLDNCFVSDEHFLPGSVKGIGAPLACLSQARFGIAWGAIGAAIACFDTTRDYLLNRSQFGKPLASHQLIQAQLADMLSEIVKAQCLNLHLARLKDQGKITPVMISLAKRNACRHALDIARAARNLLGANGISLEYPVIRHMLNLESVYTYEGTDNIHTLILGQHITGINAF
jgi:glutaryl-CoA dehydrogenase